MLQINPLGVTMGIRDFKPCKDWLRRINFIDRIELWNYIHDEAHQIARSFFLANPQYSHFLFLAEDVIATPDVVRLILEDVEKFGYPVVCGVSNVDFRNEVANIGFRNMRNLVVRGREVYQHPKISDVVQGKYGYPIIKVWFMGNTLTCIRRDVVEKLSFKPYLYTSSLPTRRWFGVSRPIGVMQDLQMCIELDALGIPIYCDVRAFAVHFTMPISEINAVGKIREVIFYGKNGEIKKIREDAPYING